MPTEYKTASTYGIQGHYGKPQYIVSSISYEALRQAESRVRQIERRIFKKQVKVYKLNAKGDVV